MPTELAGRAADSTPVQDRQAPVLIQAQGLARRWGPGQDPVFEGLDFTIGTGEFVCMIGHSGCGKTTVLNILAGLDQPSSGHVFLDGRQLQGPGLDRGVVFQQHALLPWLSVHANIALAVRSRHPDWSRAQCDEMVQRQLARVKLEHAAQRRPSELSGGMRQRVGIARALAIEPRMLLLDEPFGALDALTRGALQDELRRICSETRQTVFMITHDVDEAVLLADRIFMMSEGPRARLAKVYRNPLPADRQRNTLHHHPLYAEARKELLDFLLSGGR